MKSYISAKIVQAEPGPGPKGEPGMKLVYPDGYKSWCPEDVFRAVYREVSSDEASLVCSLLTSDQAVAT